MKAGILYQCFVTDEDLNNQYAEVLLDRSVNETELEEIALNKLKVAGTLRAHSSQLVELTKAGKAYLISFLVTSQGQPQQLLETSIKGNKHGYSKLLDAAEWLVGTRDVVLSTFGAFTTIPALNPSDAKRPEPEPISYLDLRLLSAINQQSFANGKALAEAVRGGVETVEDKEKHVSCLERRKLIEHTTDGVIRLTQGGREKLGLLEAPIDLEQEDAIVRKEYPKESGVTRLSPTANTVLCIMQVEKQLTKAKLKKIVSSQKIPDVFGSVGKAVDKLADMGLLIKHDLGVSYSDMPDLSVITLLEQKKKPLSIQLLYKDPAKFIEQAVAVCDNAEYKAKGFKDIARLKAIVDAVGALGVTITSLHAGYSLKDPNFLRDTVKEALG